MQAISQKQSILATVFYVLIFSGCTLLSVHKEQRDFTNGDTLFLWLAPLLIGLAGILYMVSQKFRATLFYSVPTIAFALLVSFAIPSTFTRILTLILFAALLLAVWFQRAKTKAPQGV